MGNVPLTFNICFISVSFKMERREKDVYLLGPSDKLAGNKLPSNKQAVGRFLYIHVKEKKTVKEASTAVIREVVQFWERARIPTKPQQHAIKKMESLFAEYKCLKKHKDRKTDTQRTNEDKFREKFDDLFDIAHAEAMTRITIEEDRQFLIAQREKGRRGTMAGIDLVLTAKEERARQRVQRQKRRRDQANEEPGPSSSVAVLASSSSSSSDDQPDETVAVFATPPPPKRAKMNIVTPSLAAALDRTKLSDRKAAFVLAEAAKSLGHNVEELNINRSSIHRHRESHRMIFARSVQDKFDPTVSLTVHWDGKLIPALTGKEQVDRLPVLVSGLGVDQLLAVPKLGRGTGAAQADAVVNALQEWDITDRVAAMSFDTTSSNTGHISGACTLIQQKLGRELLFLACRHHVLELLVEAVFSTCMVPTSGPVVLLFKRFGQKWSLMDQSSYQTAEKMANFALLEPDRDDILKFAKKQLQEKQPRDDYREFLELCVIFLGGIPEGGISFKSPGPMHHARWMSKVIYSLKVWMFSGQFKLSKIESHGLERVLVFIVKFYLKAWTTATDGVSAPASDLTLLQQLTAFEECDSQVSKAASKKLASHLWYLSEELIGLSVFDATVPLDVKRRIVQKMSEEEGLENPPKRAVVDLQEIRNKTLDDFASMNSLLLFTRLGLSTSFLEANPASWEDLEDFKTAKAIVGALKVVNDHAERGVALVQEFSGLLTKGEEQLQFLLQVVGEHRKMFPDSKKSTLTATRQQ